jgi:6-phosphofructokinase 1
MEYPSGSAIMKRTGEGADYGVTFERTELKNVAEFTKDLPDNFINEAGNGVTEAFKVYALPLCGKLPVTGYLGNNPKV